MSDHVVSPAGRRARERESVRSLLQSVRRHIEMSTEPGASNANRLTSHTSAQRLLADALDILVDQVAQLDGGHR